MTEFRDYLNDFGVANKVGLLRGHVGQVNCLEIAGKENMLISGGNDSFVNFWDCKKMRRERWIGEMGSGVTALVLSELGDEVISGHKNGEIRVNSFGELRPKFTLFGHSLRITALIIYNTKFLISSSWDSTIRIWNLFSCIQHKIMKNSSGFINTICIHSTILISGSDNRCISFWDLVSYENIEKKTESEVNYIALTNKFNKFVSGHSSGELIFWDLTERTQLCVKNGHSKPITSIKFLFSHLHFFSSSFDCTIKLWDIENFSIIKKFKLGFEITCLILSKYSNKIYLGSSKNQVAVLCYTEKNEKIRYFHGHTCIVHRCIWLKKDECLITASFDGSIRIWDLVNDAEILTLIQGNSKILDIAANDSITLLAAGCSDKTIYVWDLITLSLLNKVLYKANLIKILLFDDFKLISLTSNDTIINWKYSMRNLQELYADVNQQIRNYSILKKYLVISINTSQIVVLKLPK